MPLPDDVPPTEIEESRQGPPPVPAVLPWKERSARFARVAQNERFTDEGPRIGGTYAP